MCRARPGLYSEMVYVSNLLWYTLSGTVLVGYGFVAAALPCLAWIWAHSELRILSTAW